MSERTTAQICARMREISESRKSHPKQKVTKRKVTEYESTMVVKGGRKPKHWMTAKQIMQTYEQVEWETENRYQMFEAGKGTRFTKRTHVNKGAHYTKGGGVTTTKRPTAQGEVCSVGRVITVKRFSNSRLTCVCKSIKY